jgi:hypothetical protein
LGAVARWLPRGRWGQARCSCRGSVEPLCCVLQHALSSPLWRAPCMVSKRARPGALLYTSIVLNENSWQQRGRGRTIGPTLRSWKTILTFFPCSRVSRAGTGAGRPPPDRPSPGASGGSARRRAPRPARRSGGAARRRAPGPCGWDRRRRGSMAETLGPATSASGYPFP